MFCTAFISPGSGEFILIMLVLILLFGAKDAPRILRRVQEVLDKTQRAAASFRYKIMYGDIQSNSSSEDSYDEKMDYPEEDPEEDLEKGSEKESEEKFSPSPSE